MSDDILNRVIFPLDIPQAWTEINRMVSRPSWRVPKVLVCGPKASGKSTFGRLLANYLITREDDSGLVSTSTLCWLDLDPGQPEFSPPGQISLVQVRSPILGPPFTHAYTDQSTSFRLVRAHAIGALSPKEDPAHFLDCALDLLSVYNNLRQSISNCPLVINCPGYIVGSALEILTQLVRLSAATDIVLMKAANSQDNDGIGHMLAKIAGQTPLHNVTSPGTPPGFTGRTPAELRTMQNISYFHQVAPAQGQLRWKASLIDMQTPWILSFAGVSGDLLCILSMGEQPKPNHLHTVLEGSLIAICMVDSNEAVRFIMSRVDLSTPDKLPYWPCDQSGLQKPLDPSSSHLLGFALVQEIDLRQKLLKLQTPLPDWMCHAATTKNEDGNPKLVLVRGGLDTPGWAYLECQYASHKRASRYSGPTLIPAGEDEDLAVMPNVLPRGYEGSNTDSDNDLDEVPWVKKMRTGDTIGQRWRKRNDIGRTKRARKNQRKTI